MENNEKVDFIEIHKEGLNSLGFWREEYTSVVTGAIENIYKEEIRENYRITDIVKNGKDFLIKWERRFKL